MQALQCLRWKFFDARHTARVKEGWRFCFLRSHPDPISALTSFSVGSRPKTHPKFPPATHLSGVANARTSCGFTHHAEAAAGVRLSGIEASEQSHDSLGRLTRLARANQPIS